MGYITMNGTIPKFLEGKELPEDYYEEPNLYKSSPSCHVNLLALSRYARLHGKRMVDLTQEEVSRFSI